MQKIWVFLHGSFNSSRIVLLIANEITASPPLAINLSSLHAKQQHMFLEKYSCFAIIHPLHCKDADSRGLGRLQAKKMMEHP